MSVQLAIDFKAVASAKFFYTNQTGDIRRVKPRKPTVNNQKIPDAWSPALDNKPRETMFQLAVRRCLLDVWTPVCIFDFRNNHSMMFRGDNAKKKWKAYRKHIYDTNK